MRRHLIAAVVTFILPMSAPAMSPAWLKLYDYKKTGSGWRSGVTTPVFFFDAVHGPTNPLAELEAAKKAFSSATGTYGTLKLPAACAFPARFAVMKEMFPENPWPQPECKDLKEWLDRLNADKVSIVYASAYLGNPASILGHTFLRFYNSAGESERKSLSLLSYAVGFLARTNPAHSRLRYMWNGLTGRYKGYYDLEPFYIKIGLYNNSESRDLFEHPLNFTPEEVTFLLKHLWELLFNAEHTYYFLDENCSYRLLTFLETARPQLHLAGSYLGAVLPPETVRQLIQENLAARDFDFRASILRRLETKIERMSPAQTRAFADAHNENWRPADESDPLVLDALMDEWTLKNYRAQAKLAPEDAAKMDATFSRRAEISTTSPTLPTDAELARAKNLIPPYQSHNVSSLHAGVAYLDGDSDHTGTIDIGARLGVHGPWQNPSGYFDLSTIEYLGLDLSFDTSAERLRDWRFLIAEMKVLEPETWAWQFNIQFRDRCDLCAITEAPGERPHNNLSFSAGFGKAIQLWKWTAYAMPVATGGVWGRKWRGDAAFGWEAGLRRADAEFLAQMNFRQIFAGKEYRQDAEAGLRFLKFFSPVISFNYAFDTQNEKIKLLKLSFLVD